MLGYIFFSWCSSLWLLPNELLVFPTDSSGSVQGAQAVGFDPAAAGFLEGWEILIRQQNAGQPGSRAGSWAGYGAAQLGVLGVHAGYALGNLPDPISSRSSLGLSFGHQSYLRFGLSWHRLAFSEMPKRSVWDLGVAARPWSWLSWSLGIDALNAPRFANNEKIYRRLRFGIAVRPLKGDPRLTLGVDSRLLQAQSWRLSDTRALVGLQLIPGAQIFGAYRRALEQDDWSAGIQVDLSHIRLTGAARLNQVDALPSIARMRWQLAARAPAYRSVLPQRRQHVRTPSPADWHTVRTGLFSSHPSLSLLSWRLHEIERDPRVDTVVIPIGSNLQMGLATVMELREALLRLRRANKRVIAKLESADNKALMLAAAADEIQMDPLGHVNLEGFSASAYFLACPLEKIGVRFDAIGVGRFKSAPDALTQTHPRPEEREVMQAVMAQADAQLNTILQTERHLDASAVQAVLQTGLFNAQQAHKAGLIDKIAPDGTLEQIADVTDRTTPLHDLQQAEPRWSRPAEVVVIPVVGNIVDAGGSGGFLQPSCDAGQVVQMLESASQDPHVAGIVVRVESPGGDVMASERIWRAMMRARRHKPIAVSMGNVAASGGYYLAAPAHAIFAEAATMTGSIGIFLVKPDFSGVLNWSGIQRYVYGDKPHADWQSSMHALLEEDKQRLHIQLQSMYDAFVQRVACGRHLTMTQAYQIADGRVYTGSQAKNIGLVDQIGGLVDAIAFVWDSACVGTTQPPVVRLYEPESGWRDKMRALMQPTSLLPSLEIKSSVLQPWVPMNPNLTNVTMMALAPWSWNQP